MTARRARFLSIATCAAAVAVLTAANTRIRRDADQPAEVARLQAHFDSVLRELRGADPGALTIAQRSARAELIRRLEHYAAAGRFPHNHVRQGQFVPVFRDEHGTLCAMAHLVASTGRTDLVDAVARTNNLGYLPELARSPALRAWLDSVGLTVAEAARIQPQYGGGGCCVRPGPTEPTPEEMERRDRRAYGIASAAATPFTGASLWLNLATRDMSSTRGRVGTWLGVAAGTAQLVYGATGLRYDDSRFFMGAANVAVGASGVGTSLWRLRHRASPGSRAVDVSVAPMLTSRSAGLLLSARM